MARAGRASASVAPPQKGLYGRDTRISRNFTVAEFLKSRAIPTLRDYKLSDAEYNQGLRPLVLILLQPLRDHLGKPLRIGNGGRPASVAAKAGTTWYAVLKSAGYDPARKSDHAWFGAADFNIVGGLPGDYRRAFDWLKANKHTRQVILTTSPVTGRFYIHVAVATAQHPPLSRNRARIKQRLNA